MNFKNVQEIDNEISRLKEELENVHGTETEVYTRIVGYFRAVDNWNRGKKEEYGDRRTFVMNMTGIEEKALFANAVTPVLHDHESLDECSAGPGEISYYKLFTSQFCRNCPPVKDYVKNLSMKGEELDVSTDLGINASRKYDILSTPTVVFFDKNDQMIARANTVEEIERTVSRERQLV
jgi:hypothetical protein